ncbi:hypothetical protein D3C87_364140 [compost metagenome]
MMILPSLKSLPQEEIQSLIPLVLCIPVEGDWLAGINRKLLAATVAAVLRGVIKNTLSLEYGQVLSYWMRESAVRNVLRDRLMVEVDEAYELVVPVFAGFADKLSRFRTLDHLLTELVMYSPSDGSIVVRISNG